MAVRLELESGIDVLLLETGDALLLEKDGITYSLSLTDSIVLGDTPSTGVILIALSSDGITVNDTPSSQVILKALATDGIAITDIGTVIRVSTVAVVDGINLDDTPTTAIVYQVLATDGITLTDLSIGDIRHAIFLILKLLSRSLTTKLSGRTLTVALHNRSLTTGLEARTLTVKLYNRSLTAKVRLG